jgi:RNA polymerase sigma-70 factor (ECF subfamily)
MTGQPQTNPAEPLSDPEIVERVVGGDTALFELLMRRYNQRVYRCVRAIVRDESEAEDAMQQAYLNAFVNLRQFAGRSSFSTWLTRIAVNEALARVRPRALRAVSDGETTISDIESPHPDPEQQAATAEMTRAVEEEIGALPDSYRVVLILREVEGLSTSETAAAIGIAEDAVKTRLHRARGLLRDNLYRHAGLTFDRLFTFGAERCDRVVGRVMAAVLKS